MSYRKHIDECLSHLVSLGINPNVREGTKLSNGDFASAELTLGRTLPSELKAYLLEMGDGFTLTYEASPVTGNKDDYFWWKIDYFQDILEYAGSIHEDMNANLSGRNDMCQSAECIAESRKRLSWFPVFGIGGGGYTFCIDNRKDSGEIRFHDIRMSDDYFPSIVLAPSIDEWMSKWSRFCFSQPLYDSTDNHAFLESYCWEKEGTFDWSPKRFRSDFDRLKSES